MRIWFDISNMTITRRDDLKVVSDNKSVTAEFGFALDTWGRSIKTAAFTKNGKTYYVDMPPDPYPSYNWVSCIIPAQVLQEPGIIEVSLHTGDLLTTNTATVRVYPSGYKEEEPPEELSASEQFIKSTAGQDGIRGFKIIDGSLAYQDSTGEWHKI